MKKRKRSTAYKKHQEFPDGKTCNFCNTSNNDTTLFGEIYQIYDIIVHYFCLLSASEVRQLGKDYEGLLGFYTRDIRNELKRGQKNTCFYCKKKGATVACVMKSCNILFHLPCGLRNGSLHQYHMDFKSFCKKHKPKQDIPPSLKRKKVECPMCMSQVIVSKEPYIWPPCCKPDVLMHKYCCQQYAANSGYSLKCPLCNNKNQFKDGMQLNGVYVPDQEPTWELEELNSRRDSDNVECMRAKGNGGCLCPRGSQYSINLSNLWYIEICVYCGSGMHLGCMPKNLRRNEEYKCESCLPVAERSERRAEEFEDDDSSNSVNASMRLLSTSSTVAEESVQGSSQKESRHNEHSLTLASPSRSSLQKRSHEDAATRMLPLSCPPPKLLEFVSSPSQATCSDQTGNSILAKALQRKAVQISSQCVDAKKHTKLGSSITLDDDAIVISDSESDNDSVTLVGERAYPSQNPNIPEIRCSHYQEHEKNDQEGILVVISNARGMDVCPASSKSTVNRRRDPKTAGSTSNRSNFTLSCESPVNTVNSEDIGIQITEACSITPSAFFDLEEGNVVINQSAGKRPYESSDIISIHSSDSESELVDVSSLPVFCEDGQYAGNAGIEVKSSGVKRKRKKKFTSNRRKKLLKRTEKKSPTMDSSSTTCTESDNVSGIGIGKNSEINNLHLNGDSYKNKCKRVRESATDEQIDTAVCKKKSKRWKSSEIVLKQPKQLLEQSLPLPQASLNLSLSVSSPVPTCSKFLNNSSSEGANSHHVTSQAIERSCNFQTQAGVGVKNYSPQSPLKNKERLSSHNPGTVVYVNDLKDTSRLEKINSPGKRKVKQRRCPMTPGLPIVEVSHN